MERDNLKIRKFTNPNQTFITERYVIENKEDLKKTLGEFPQLNNNFMGVESSWKEALAEGRTILVTDESWAGFPTYQFESPEGETHPSCLIRIMLDT